MARNGLAHNEPYLWDNRYMKFNGIMVHNIVWEGHNGIIPEGYFVHHINENKTDNRIENLKLITRAEHCKLHRPRKCNKCRSKDNRERRMRYVPTI